MFRPRIRTLAAVGIGAAAAYLWDPENGQERRDRLSDQLRSLTAGTSQEAISPWVDTTGTEPAPTDAPVTREGVASAAAGNGAS